MKALDTVVWNRERLAEGIEALARRKGWCVQAAHGQEIPPAHGGLEAWMEQCAAATGIDCEAVSFRYANVDRELSALGTSVIALPHDRFLVVTRTRRRYADALTPGGEVVPVPLQELRDVLCRGIESRFAGDVDRLLAGSGGAARARGRMLRELVGDAPVGEAWIVRPRLERVRDNVRDATLIAKALAFAGANAAQTLLFVASWWILGLMAFETTSLDTLFALWVLCVLSLVPLRAAEAAAGRALALEGGILLKRRLLAGALKLTPDEAHGKGIGTFLSHVLEAAAIEAVGASGAFGGITAIVGAIVATAVLARGAGGPAHALLYVAAVIVVAIVTLRFARVRDAWTEARFALTGHVVENMIGHKTRLAQKEPEQRNSGEDRRLEEYVATEAALNRNAIALEMLRRVWPWAGLFALTPLVITGSSSAAVAVSAGGVLLGATALNQWVDASARIAAAAISWRRVSGYWHAADRTHPAGTPALHAAIDGAGEVEALPLLHAASITYRHRNREQPALDQVDLVVRSGDHVLLGGPSGSGKSTLSAILSGVRPLQSGMLFFRGLDIGSVGVENWRRRVLLAPQFHANHIFVGTLAYNLLLGRGWPAAPADLEAARTVCRALGLGPLIARMPLGLNQPVGETGWQLSHGERTRVYLARAILQDPALMILDETFAALDPETLAASMSYVRQRPGALLVVAHT
jgi:ATP-binding cassette subfamily B protein